MRALILVLLAAVIGLGVLAGQQAVAIKAQQHQITAINERIKVAALAQQERCSDEAHKWFERQQYGVNDLASYQNHYNEKLNKCMIEVESKFFGKGVVISFDRIVNAFENRQVATFINQNGQITHCNLTNPSGVIQQCNSADEFKKLAVAYMEG